MMHALIVLYKVFQNKESGDRNVLNVLLEDGADVTYNYPKRNWLRISAGKNCRYGRIRRGE